MDKIFLCSIILLGFPLKAPFGSWGDAPIGQPSLYPCVSFFQVMAKEWTKLCHSKMYHEWASMQVYGMCIMLHSHGSHPCIVLTQQELFIFAGNQCMNAPLTSMSGKSLSNHSAFATVRNADILHAIRKICYHLKPYSQCKPPWMAITVVYVLNSMTSFWSALKWLELFPRLL